MGEPSINSVEGTKPLTVEWKGEGEKSGPVKCCEWDRFADEVPGLDATGDSGMLRAGRSRAAGVPGCVGGSEFIGVALDTDIADS